MPDRNQNSYREELGILQQWVDAALEETPSEEQWQTAQYHLIERIRSSRKENFIMALFRKKESLLNRWVAATAFAALVIALVIGFNSFDHSPDKAYAAVIDQIRKARTVSYTLIQKIKDMPDQKIKMIYKEPGMMRQEWDQGIVSIVDITQKKGITITPPQKQFIDMDFSSMPAQATQVNLVEQLKKLPSQTDKIIPAQNMDQYVVQGFQVTENSLNKTVWVDVETGNLFRIEGEFQNAPGVNFVMSDFKFDEDLEDSLFDLTPPQGYSRVAMKANTHDINEEDLIFVLRFWADHTEDTSFPPSLDLAKFAKSSMELNKNGKFHKDENKEGLSNDKLMEKTLQDSQKMTKGLMFVMQMKPDSDWHYAGDTVKMGEKEKPVFWWKPTGKQDYRMIYGDLSIKDVSAEEIPKGK